MTKPNFTCVSNEDDPQWKKTSNIKNGRRPKKNKNGRRPQIKNGRWPQIKNGRQPQIKNGRRPQRNKMEDDLKNNGKKTPN